MADRDLQAGHGVELDDLVAGILTASVTNVSKKVIVIDSIEKYPNVVGGISYPSANTKIILPNDSTGAIPFVVNVPGVSFYGDGVFSSGHVYTGTMPFITSTDESVSVSDLSITAVDADEVFTCATVNMTNALNLTNVRFLGCKKLGTLTGVSPVFTNVVTALQKSGWSFSGMFIGFRVDGGYMTDEDANNTFFDLGSAQFLGFDMLGVKMTGLGKYLSSSVGGTGNMLGGIEAVVKNCNFGYGTGTALTGFENGWFTNNWAFEDNSPNYVAKNTRNFADMYLAGMDDFTVIPVAVADTFYEIGDPDTGAWQSNFQERFSLNAGGWLDYTGSKPIDLSVDFTGTIDKSGGGADYLVARVAVGWTAGDQGAEESSSPTNQTTPSLVAGGATFTIQPGQNIRPIFKNRDSSSNIDVYACRMVVFGA